MKRLLLPGLCAAALAFAGCSSAYYSTMEKFGYAKRELLVDSIQDTRKAQTEAKDQFANALAQFMAVTRANGGDLQKTYDALNRELNRSETRAQAVRDRIEEVEDVAEALFREWRQELRQYSNPSLRTESERQLGATRQRYEQVVDSMRRSAARMEPVLATFRDQVLFLKHNLNARAVASLDGTHRELQTEIRQLIADMDASIREADAFIRTLQATENPGAAGSPTPSSTPSVRQQPSRP